MNPLASPLNPNPDDKPCFECGKRPTAPGKLSVRCVECVMQHHP